MMRCSSTGVRGVHFKDGKFRAVGYHQRQPIYLGTFDKMNDAKKAYDAWKELPKSTERLERRQTDSHKEERASPDMYAIVEGVFRRCYERNKILSLLTEVY
jgi:hypothetical protein